MQSKAMFALAEKLKTLRDGKKDAEAQMKQLNADIVTTEQELAQLMLDSETQNFTRGGTMYCLTTIVRASTVAGHKEDLFHALRQQGFGDLVYETVNANSLSAFVKEQMSENDYELPEWLCGLVNPFEKTGVSVRKSTK